MTPEAQPRTLQPRGFPGLPADWVSEWETFRSADESTKLFAQTHRHREWAGERSLVLIHGMGEHSGRYLHLPHYLQGSVRAVHVFDLRGHGRSEGVRGHVERFDSLVDDCAFVVRRFHESVLKKFGRAEVHLLGHSLGGHLALRTALLNPDLPVRTLQVSAPFLGLHADVPLFKRLGAQTLARVWGSLQLDTGLDARGICRDPEVVSAYLNDRLVHGKMTPRFFAGLTRAMVDTLSRDHGIEPPLQMLVPLADRIVDSEASQRFFRRLKHRDKRLKTYPGCYHEPMNEPCKEEVFADIRSWIDAHAEGAAATGASS